MCAPDPNETRRQQAKIEHQNRVFAFRGRELAYMNKSAVIKSKQRDVKGLIKSRDLSDLQVGLDQQKGKWYKKVEVASRDRAKQLTTGVGAKGGSMSRQAKLRGGSKAADILFKKGKAEAAYELAKGRGQAIAQEGIRRKVKASDAKLRQEMGLPPTFGATVKMASVPDNRAMTYLSTGLSIASLFASDKRMKENIEEVGKSEAGHKIYEWNYIADKTTRYRGVIAQDVVKIDPMAVTVMENGYLGVNYRRLDVNMEVVS